MKLSKSISRTIWLVTFVTVIILFILVSLFLNFKNSIENDPRMSISELVIPDEQAASNFGLPRRLKIPSINIDAAVLSVGLTPDGAMDTPKNSNDVAWFNLGERPGNLGSAVVTGHYGTWKDGNGSVFDDLYKLKKGDKLYIEDDKGEVATFVVRESRSYDPKADATDVFSAEDELSHLNLITCEGVWNDEIKSFDKRLVVFADKE